MLEQENLSRKELIRELGISEDTLAVYEHELDLDINPISGGLEKFTKEEREAIRVFHKLREAGLTYNEMALLSSFSEVSKNVDFEDIGGIKNLLLLSPMHRLKQSLNLARQELHEMKDKIKELEEELNEVSESKKKLSMLQLELDAKQRTIQALDRKLSESQLLRAQLETQLALHKEGKVGPLQVKGKKSKELYQIILQKETELQDIKRKSEELQDELNSARDEALELRERFERVESEVVEMEQIVEERYKGQIGSLRAQVEDLIDKKQKEWESYFKRSNDQHKDEILTLQKKHEGEILRLKQKIREQIRELQELKSQKNPFLGFLKIGAEGR